MTADDVTAKLIKMKKLFLLFLFQCLFGGFNFTYTQDLTKQIENIFNESEIPGMSVAIFDEDSMLYEKAFGFSDLSTSKPYTLNTTLNIGSISKTFIAVALMKLYEEGKINLDADINDYLPFDVRNPYFPNTPISLRHLSTHTSSINDRLGNYDSKALYARGKGKISTKGLPLKYKILFKWTSKNNKITLGEFLKNHLGEKGKFYKKKSFFKSKPGTKFEYSNLGSALAAYIIEHVSGMSYGDYVKTQILSPLEMNSSDWSLNKINSEHFAKNYINKIAVPDYNLITYPDGGLISSTNDLVKFCRKMILGYKGEESILNKHSFHLMMSNQFEIEPLRSSGAPIQITQGIFWYFSDKSGEDDIGHGGANPGIRTYMFFSPTLGIGCILTANCGGKNEYEKISQIWEILIKYRNSLK